MTLRTHERASVRCVAVLAATVTLFTAAGCSGRYRSGVYESRYTRYVIDEPAGSWSRIRRTGVNVAFGHPSGAGIYVDDSCRRYDDAPLHVLANHLFFGFTQVEVESTEDMEIDGRAAYRRVVRGRMDGVPVRVAATVMKKDDCVYDFVYVAAPGAFESGLAEYERVVRSFRVDR